MFVYITRLHVCMYVNIRTVVILIDEIAFAMVQRRKTIENIFIFINFHEENGVQYIFLLAVHNFLTEYIYIYIHLLTSIELTMLSEFL